LFQDIIEGNILQMPEKVMETLKAKYLVSNIQYRGLQRVEKLIYPEAALREAILNAIVHKDYTGTSIQLSVYDNKLILWNEGKLPEDLSIAKLLTKHPSRPRNKRIADVFFKAGLVEIWGRGIAKINEALLEAKMAKVLVTEQSSGIQLQFIHSIIPAKNRLHEYNVVENVVENSENVVENPENVVENLEDVVENTEDVVENSENVVENPENVIENSERILELLIQNNKLSAQQLAIQLSLSERTIQRHLKKLQQNNSIKRIGAAKGGYWKVLHR
jgi:ATP-dependent DNA helicase RecG